MTEAHAEVAEAAGNAENATVMTRAYFSSYQLWSAVHFAWLAQEIEDSNLELQYANRVQHRAYVINGVVAAAAFVEASINEVFQDVADGHDWHGQLDAQAKTALKLLWNVTNEGKTAFSALDKYNLALGLTGNEPFDSSRNPYQDAKLIFDIRNWLMHFKPQSVSHEEPAPLSKKLSGKFALNPLYVGKGYSLFPDQMLSAGCAAWAHRSARLLVDAFSASLELSLHHEQVDFGDPKRKFTQP